MPAMNTALASLQHLGTPACAVNQHGRLISFNPAASAFFGTSADMVLGAEWHTVVQTLQAPACCALCQTRRALRSGDPVAPVQVWLSLAGCRRQVTMIPLPLATGPEAVIAFLLLAQEATSQPEQRPIPFQPRVRQLADERIIAELTGRERQILDCVVNGLDARGIATRLGITHATARNYVQRILNKLGARNKAEAVSVALTYNLLAS